MVLDQVRLDFSIRKDLIEARFAGGFGGHRFWLLTANIFATVLLAIAFALFLNLWLGVFVTLTLAFVLFWIQIDELWLKLTKWRREK